MQQVLGVAIGIALICLLLSIIASHVQEILASFVSSRARTLEAAVLKMLDDPQLYSIFLNHPLIQNISFHPPRFLKLKFLSTNKPRPTYIPSPLFSKVLMAALVTRYDAVVTDFPGLVAIMPESSLKTKLLTLMTGILHDAEACRLAVEQWYDNTMDRVNGFYKRQTQWILLGLGLLLAILCNADLLSITTRLWNSQAARDQVNAVAQMYSCNNGPECEALRKDYDKARRTIEEDLRTLPVGYDLNYTKNYWRTFNQLDIAHNESRAHHTLKLLAHWLINLFGWLLTGIAVSLGAPFWFDALNKFVNLRITGAKPPKAGQAQG
jgi:hypothetical protein